YNQDWKIAKQPEQCSRECFRKCPLRINLLDLRQLKIVKYTKQNAFDLRMTHWNRSGRLPFHEQMIFERVTLEIEIRTQQIQVQNFMPVVILARHPENRNAWNSFGIHFCGILQCGERLPYCIHRSG